MRTAAFYCPDEGATTGRGSVRRDSPRRLLMHGRASYWLAASLASSGRRSIWPSALLPGRHLVLLDQIFLSYRHRKAAGKSLMADRSDGEDLVHQLVDLAEP